MPDLQSEFCDKHTGMIMIKILELEPRCHYCNEIITENNFGGIFSKPTRLCCDNLLCMSELITEIEE